MTSEFESDNLLLVMTSPFNGYIKNKHRNSFAENIVLGSNGSVPDDNSLMLSINIELCCLSIKLYSHGISGVQALHWDTDSEDIPDFLVSSTAKVTVSFFVSSCFKHKLECFKLLFSFHPKDKTPQKLEGTVDETRCW